MNDSSVFASLHIPIAYWAQQRDVKSTYGGAGVGVAGPIHGPIETSITNKTTMYDKLD